MGLVGAIVLSQALPAEARGFDDREVVQLSKTGMVRGAGGLGLHLTPKDAVVATNLALAATTCNDCRATAISFQVVVADRAPLSVDVRNFAYAVDQNCARCEATAIAYQFVLVFQGDAKLSGAGHRQLERIGAALGRLAKSGASQEEVQASAAEYAAQVLELLSSEIHVRPLVHRKVEHHGHGNNGEPVV
jgi:hypothetical protein